MNTPVRYCRWCDIWFGEDIGTCSICGHRTIKRDEAYRRKLI